MQRMTYAAGRNPFSHLLSLVAAAVVAVVAFLLGAVLLAVVVGLLALGVLAFSLRLWWLRRKLSQTRAAEEGQPQIIEAEYTVVERRQRPRD